MGLLPRHRTVPRLRCPHALLLALPLVLLAGCEGDAGRADRLTAEEAGWLVDALLALGIDDPPPDQETPAECPGGGSLVVQSAAGVVPGEPGQVTLLRDGALGFADCQGAGATGPPFTLRGTLQMGWEWEYLLGTLEASLGLYGGTLLWDSEGRGGACFTQLSLALEAGERTLLGTVCGHGVQRLL